MSRNGIPLVSIALVSALALAGCAGSPNSETAPQSAVEVEVPEEVAGAENTFVDGVLTLSDVKFEITDYRVIPVGESGNEYGDVPVLAIWYDTTNLGTSDRDIHPSLFGAYLEAFQDNDPDRENTLNVPLWIPDEAFRDTKTENIKAGGTVANAIAFELDDTVTPVELVAGARGEEFGRMTIKLS